MRSMLVVVALLAVGCGASSPSAPAPVAPTPAPIPVPPPPVPVSYTIAGTVTATNGGQPLAGLAVLLNGQPATTTSAGGFIYSLMSGGVSRLTLDGSEIVPRALSLNVASARSVPIGAISLGGGFDLAYYRALVRNGYEAPDVLQPIRRWTQTPNLYLKTVDEVGEAIHGPTLNVIEAALKDAVPRWTSGALGVPFVERGTGTREGVSGWITIKFPATNTILEGYCGRAQVGVDGGWIELNYHNPPINGAACRTATAVIAAHVVQHEVGHALGFYHTAIEGDVLYVRGSWFSTTGLPSPRELAHAAIAYTRPVGNVDPDSDPTGTVNLAPMALR